jgi:hypothetical protein
VRQFGHDGGTARGGFEHASAGRRDAAGHSA